MTNGINNIPLKQTHDNNVIENDFITPKKIKNNDKNSKIDKSESMTVSRENIRLQTSQIMNELFEEIELDDRRMYRLTPRKIKLAGTTVTNELSNNVISKDFIKNLTYGEIEPESVSKIIIPLLDPTEEDNFYDLGCGTGKIVVQFALETNCKTSIGIELIKERVAAGEKALTRLEEIIKQNKNNKTFQLTNMMDIKNRIQILVGDVCCPPEKANLENATLIFMNNVCFGPELMNIIMNKLKELKYMKKLITLTKICERHSDRKCKNRGNLCTQFYHPPKEYKIEVTWTDQASLYYYQKKIE